MVAAFYESLATRDIYVGRIMRFARRRKLRAWQLGAVYLATVGIGIPLLLLVWAFVLTVALVLVGSVERADSAADVAVSVVGAARVLAYVRQRTAQDLSRAIPLALAVLLLGGGALNLEPKLERLQAASQSGLTNDLLLLLVGLELALRILTDSVTAGLAAYRRRRGIVSDLGMWRTIWTLVRRTTPSGVHAGGAADGVAD